MKIPRLLLLMALLGSLAATPALGSKKAPRAPEGVKVASSTAFDIYVVAKESKPFGATGWMLGIFESTVVVHNTRKHGRQLIRSRVEAINADLLDPSMWQIADFDGDGSEDYRVVAQISNKKCRTWNTQVWHADRERFSFGAKIVHQTDVNGKVVKSCA